MTIIHLVRSELRRLTASKMAILALIALMMVPVLYAGLYLWGNNDPYGNLKEVPVGLVVEDTGATTTDLDGTSTDVNFGRELHDQLLADNSFHWIDTSAAGAARGVSDGTFDFVLTLGPDFSSALASPTTDAPRQATVELTTNDTNSFLASTIAGQVAEKVRASIAEKVGKQAALTFLEGFATIRSSLNEATDGAAQLADGTGTALSGSTQLSAGAASANDGATRLAAGAATANDGAQRLSGGLQELRSKAADLPAKAAALNDGAQRVAQGNGELAQAGSEIAATAQQIVDAIPSKAEMTERLTELGLDSDQIGRILSLLDPAEQHVTEGNARIQTLNAELGALGNGSRELADGTAELAAAAPGLADGTAQAADKASALAAGTQQLADKSAALASGTGQLSTGASALEGGISRLDSGAKELASGLRDGLDRVPRQDADQRESTAAIIADPARIDTSAVTKASTYGAGMAPFFISLAAWIGIYALFLIIKPLSKRALTAIRKPARVAAAGWLTPGILGAVQMVAVFGIVTLALGYSVTNPGWMLGFIVVVSLTYASIILALNIWLGSVGQFLGLVLMVLQLVTAGGTFPWQTLPAPLAALHHALPMSYAVDGIRQLMYGGNLWLALADLLVLLAFLTGALALSWLGARRMTRFRTLRDLRPSLIG